MSRSEGNLPPRVLIIVQARMGSTRFPGKSMARIAGLTPVEHLVAQLAFCHEVDSIVLAVPEGPGDDVLAEHGLACGCRVFRGSEDDVLDRFFGAALANGGQSGAGIVRLTADDILPDPGLIDAVALLFKSMGGRFDYVCTDRAGRLPYGASVELISFDALSRAHREARAAREREHVVPYVKWNPNEFPSLELTSSLDLSDIVSLSIDTPNDLDRVARLVGWLDKYRSRPYRLHDVLAAAQAVLPDPRSPTRMDVVK
jgi:spore coat polysaccharide biosynthesis protein SpsF